MNLTCPHCKRPCTITTDDLSKTATCIQRKHKGDEFYALNVQLVTCPNMECGKVTAIATLTSGLRIANTSSEFIGLVNSKFIARQVVYPIVEPNIRDIPDYVPTAIRNDYIEAVRIIRLSPKASATLARRCIQGMIRDFWGISKSRLIEEINELKDRVDPITWETIDAIRKIGNIGAHMEKDVNEIIDIEPEEADLLVKLIEDLIEDWYVSRNTREEHKKMIIKLAKEKTS